MHHPKYKAIYTELLTTTNSVMIYQNIEIHLKTKWQPHRRRSTWTGQYTSTLQHTQAILQHHTIIVRNK